MRKYPPRPTLGKLDANTDPAAAPRVPEASTPIAPGRGGKPRGKSGPAPDPDALSAQLDDGRGSHLHAVIPADLHRRVKVHGVMSERTVSAIVADALMAYLEGVKG